MAEWLISPYPDGKDFAFTIVHDADDAYSRRLEPLFQVFNEFGVKLSMTAFAFWADRTQGGDIWSPWSSGDPFWTPQAVPLEDPVERDFYRRLIDQGHEVGLHTPSDGDDLREDVERAFETYRGWFGQLPPIYVEHRDNLENQYRLGSQPDSPYYITDLLNRYRPWFWAVSPSAIPYNGWGRYFDLLSDQRPSCGWTAARLWGGLKHFLKTRTLDAEAGPLFERMLRGGTPFDPYVQRKYGIARAFRRSGRRENSHGEGFCEWYSPAHVEELDRRHGLAIVYTHLNTRWLDRQTRQMHAAIHERLKDIASRNVWLATASTILDRFDWLRHVALTVQDGKILLVNQSGQRIDGLTLRSSHSSGVRRGNEMLRPNRRGHMVIGPLEPQGTLELSIAE